MRFRRALFWYVVVVLVHAVYWWYRNKTGLAIWHGALEQEDFIAYTRVLMTGSFSHNSLPWYDIRFFPGLPLVMASIARLLHIGVASAGLLATFLGLSLAYWASYAITRSVPIAWLVTVFPPIALEQFSKISTEALVVGLLLTALLLLSRKRASFWVGPVLALAILVRPIAGCFLLAVLVWCYRERRYEQLLVTGLWGIVALVGYFSYNLIYGGSWWWQLPVDISYGRASIGIVQLVADVGRAVSWREWRILFSGVMYVGLAAYIVYRLVATRTDLVFLHDRIFWRVWAIATFVFVLAYGPTPILEEIGRFLMILTAVGIVALGRQRIAMWMVLGLSFVSLIAVLH